MTPFSIVREIPTIIQQDYLYLKNIWNNPIQQVGGQDTTEFLEQRRERTARVILIAVRALALLGVILTMTSALTFWSLFKVAFYHEAFVLAHNLTQLNSTERSTQTGTLQGFFSRLGYFFQEVTQGTEAAVTSRMTQGTIFPSFWNDVLRRLIESQRGQTISGGADPSRES